jgi:hypothetical protein
MILSYRPSWSGTTLYIYLGQFSLICWTVIYQCSAIFFKQSTDLDRLALLVFCCGAHLTAHRMKLLTQILFYEGISSHRNLFENTTAKATFKSFPELLLLNVWAFLVHTLLDYHLTHLSGHFPDNKKKLKVTVYRLQELNAIPNFIIIFQIPILVWFYCKKNKYSRTLTNSGFV